jgi:hypothetical protein
MLAWLAMVGVDLLFHAGLFAAVFDRAREPSLLADEALFRRIPVAYLTLLVGATVLAWLLSRLGATGGVASIVGSASGLVVGVMGLGALWTAVDITGLLVLAGTIVLVVQGAAAAKVLTSEMPTRALVSRVLGFVLTCFVVGQIAANLLG